MKSIHLEHLRLLLPFIDSFRSWIRKAFTQIRHSRPPPIRLIYFSFFVASILCRLSFDKFHTTKHKPNTILPISLFCSLFSVFSASSVEDFLHQLNFLSSLENRGTNQSVISNIYSFSTLMFPTVFFMSWTAVCGGNSVMDKFFAFVENKLMWSYSLRASLHSCFKRLTDIYKDFQLAKNFFLLLKPQRNIS